MIKVYNDNYGDNLNYDPKVEVYAQKACDLNFGDGCVLLGEIYFGHVEDPEQFELKAQQNWQKGCDLGSAKSCRRLVVSNGKSKD